MLPDTFARPTARATERTLCIFVSDELSIVPDPVAGTGHVFPKHIVVVVGNPRSELPLQLAEDRHFRPTFTAAFRKQ